MAVVMMLLTTQILLCSTPGSRLNSKDGAGTAFVTASTSPFQTHSESHTTAQRSTILINSQSLSNCQEDLKTFNSTLNSSYLDQWSEKVATSLYAFNGSINNLISLSQVKTPKNTSEEFENETKDLRAIELSTWPRVRLVKDSPSGMISEQNATPILKKKAI
ncbi:hypothetical protein PoB_000832900 [Plakobranchus ocellatus]|uniref:Uncharacterized protein n=1 Tax=Plakobranchus ocellatus TaxID=259542 RepID=A0AAV3YFR3_9GAST|nr:hypothetical protein PoB_000832900 [Plakobranchus ocellatus]